MDVILIVISPTDTAIINAQFMKNVAIGYLIQQKYHNDTRNTLP